MGIRSLNNSIFLPSASLPFQTNVYPGTNHNTPSFLSRLQSTLFHVTLISLISLDGLYIYRCFYGLGLIVALTACRISVNRGGYVAASSDLLPAMVAILPLYRNNITLKVKEMAATAALTRKARL